MDRRIAVPRGVNCVQSTAGRPDPNPDSNDGLAHLVPQRLGRFEHGETLKKTARWRKRRKRIGNGADDSAGAKLAKNTG